MSSSLKDNASPATFTPADFFALATWLYDTKPDQVSPCLVRTIISRAYYAALISARDYTKSSTIGKGGHKTVIAALRQHDPYAASKLDSLRLKRTQADYKTDSGLTTRDAQISLQASREVLYASNCVQTPGKPYTADFLDCSLFMSNQPE